MYTIATITRKTKKFGKRIFYFVESFYSKKIFNKAKENYSNMGYYTRIFHTWKKGRKQHQLWVCKKPKSKIQTKRSKSLKIKYGASKRQFNKVTFFLVHIEPTEKAIDKKRLSYKRLNYTRIGKLKGKFALYVRKKSLGKI
jgi:prenyltransferase beta subunit